ncbi:MAG: DUF4956 domain-containing protein [Clostridia bacterium]|nr:DUF4956 domain-containing protein [Clostridia bacterium]
MFDSVFSSEVSVGAVFSAIGTSIFFGIVFAFLVSLKLRSSKGFLTTVALMPTIVSAVFIFLNIMVKKDTTLAMTSIAVVMVGLGLIRFRSAQGKAEEMITLFGAVAIGAVNGLGYILYGGIFALLFSGLYLALSALGFLKSRKNSGEKLLKITIPESLEYNGAFDETFKHYLKEVEQVGVKTTGMGSMFRISYRIVMKDSSEEKELIDELRIKNGNLEISILPYIEDAREL